MKNTLLVKQLGLILIVLFLSFNFISCEKEVEGPAYEELLCNQDWILDELTYDIEDYDYYNHYWLFDVTKTFGILPEDLDKITNYIQMYIDHIKSDITIEEYFDRYLNQEAIFKFKAL